ncbi:MAG: hypothetical protein ABR987_15630, partial [Terracidiphilus sp.]
MLQKLALVIMLAGVLPISGELQSPNPNGNGATNPAPPPSRTITCAVKQDGTAIECNSPKGVPETYLNRLFTAENTPNIALFFVGLGGVLAATGTLISIKQQVVEMRRQVQASHDGLRAWIGIDVRENELPVFSLQMMDQITGLLKSSPPRFVWEIKN